MGYHVFKDAWDINKHQEHQWELAWSFLHLLNQCVNQAATEAQSLQLDANDPKAAHFYRRWEGFSYGTKTREYKGAIRIFKASYGSAVEERTYQLLEQNDEIWVEDYGDWDDFNFATELQGADPESGFDHSFRGRGGGKGSRPDIRLALGNGFEALYDITANTPISQGHINGKGANGWLKRPNVPFIAEIYYDGI